MKKCKQGYYYCYKDEKCKRIPRGYRVGLGGWLRKEKEEEKTEDTTETETKKNGNGDNNGGNGDSGAVSEGWSEKYKKSIDCKNPKGFSQRAHCQGRKKVSEEKMSAAQKRKDTMLKKKYDKSDMKQNMIDQYGEEEGTKIYFATIRKQAMKKKTKKMNEAKEKGDHEVSMARKQVEKSADNLKKLAKVLSKKTDKDNLPAWVQAKITNIEHGTDAASSYMDEGKRDGKSAKDKGYSLRDWFKGGGWVQAGGKYDGKPCAKQPGQKTKPFCRDADDRASMSKKERNRRAAKKRREDPNPNRKGKAKMVGEAYDTTGTRFEKMKGDAVINALKATKEFKQMKGELVKTAPVKLANSFCNWRQELELSEEGKKDACYYKVKSRYSVWPSAYASGALVKCRKVGAKNWGNKTKKESYEYSNWRDDFIPTDYETVDLITADPIQVPDSNIQKIEEAKKCWKGYEKKGTQKLFGKTYNRCVKKEEFSNWREELAEELPRTSVNVGDKFKGKAGMMSDKEIERSNKGIGDRIRGTIKLQKAHFEPEGEIIEGAAWTKKSGKNPKGGLNEKGRKSYERENPGSDLKAPSKKVGNKRRASFCARMKGMKKKLTSKKTANDPNSRINKSLRAWNC